MFVCLAIDFFLELVTAGKDQLLAEQLRYQLKVSVFKNLRFGSLHNSLRYPIYHQYQSDYSISNISENDCLNLRKMLQQLKEYLKQIRIIV